MQRHEKNPETVSALQVPTTSVFWQRRECDRRGLWPMDGNFLLSISLRNRALENRELVYSHNRLLYFSWYLMYPPANCPTRPPVLQHSLWHFPHCSNNLELITLETTLPLLWITPVAVKYVTAFSFRVRTGFESWNFQLSGDL